MRISYSLRKILLILSGLLFLACDQVKKEIDSSEIFESSERSHIVKPDNVYRFGFDLRHGPQEDARQYLPLMQYLENETGFKFTLKFSPKDKSTEQMLGEQELDFAAIGATAYIRAKEKFPVISVVRGLNSMNESSYRSMLVTRVNSRIKTVRDLKEKHLAFGSPNSTQGHLIPRIILKQNKISLSDLKQYTYTGSHRNCAEAVISKKADACGMQDSLAIEMAKKGLIKIFFKSASYPSSGIAANKKVGEEVINKVREALISFMPLGKHKKGLYNWHFTEMPNGFIEADDADYEPLKDWMAKLGMLN